VPGHHLQIALAQELDDLPSFRRNAWLTAFGEGWALYAESLGEHLGFYTDPYSRYGAYMGEMWRAIRLVVDTGMHALGWSREQGIEFAQEKAGRYDHDVVVEIDRYLVWPGQALAYKIGELQFQKLRRRAAAALDEQFDLRAFHDEVLRHGCLPLDLLEERVAVWMADAPNYARGVPDGSREG
jgi:prolyl oligopeptidase